jgi:hypothetical protein
MLLSFTLSLCLLQYRIISKRTFVTKLRGTAKGDIFVVVTRA